MSDTAKLKSSQLGDLIQACRCIRCGNEDANAGKGGWSGCFTVCDECWPEPAKSVVEGPSGEAQ